MDPRLQIVAVIATGILLLAVFELVRQRRLMERYALLWMFSAVVLLLLAVFSGLLMEVSDAIGVATPSNALFVIAFGFVTLLLLNFSAVISRLADQAKVLAQRLAATEERLRRAESELDALRATHVGDPVRTAPRDDGVAGAP